MNVKDADFKNLAHRVGNQRITSLGTEVASGYKPDLTVKDAAGRLTYIIECEQKTDRKAFLGDLVKAEKYAEECEAHPTLVIVMQVFGNTTIQQITNHLMPYAIWLSGLKGGELNLAEILVMADTEYKASVDASEVLGSPQFRMRAQRVYIQP